MKKVVVEARSRQLKQANEALKIAEYLQGVSKQMVGAVSEDEIKKTLVNSMRAAKGLMDFAYGFLQDSDDDYFTNSPEIKNAIADCSVACGRLKIMESKDVMESIDYVDPYEAEYLPANMLTEVPAKGITESVIEDADPLPDDLDDDPDAVMTLDTDGMPVRFNADPIEVDPFALKLFRNNADLIDPPEVFDAVSDASVTVEPDIEPGSATEVTIDDADREQVIDVIADGEPKEVEDSEEDEESKEEEIADVELPSDDFDVFANESTVVVPPKSKVTPKESKVLPPQFSETEAKHANDNISEDPCNNLKMLSLLMKDW